MAIRRVTHTYRTVVEFLEDHAGTLGQGGLLLPAGTVSGELAAELKLDLLVPPLGRLGPIDAQVVHRGSDGSVALRIAEWPAPVTQRIDELHAAVKDLKAWWLASGQVAAAGRGERRQAEAAQGKPAPQAAPAGASGGRGIPVPDLGDRAPDAQGKGTLDELRALFTRLAVDRSSGLFTHRSPGGRVRRGFWSQGGPVAWRSDPIDESEVLGVLLYKAEQLTREQLSESLEIMQRDGCRQGDALISMGLMSFPQLVMVLGKQCEFVLQRVLSEPAGSWTFHHLDTMPERFLPSPIRVPAMIFRTLFQQARSLKGDQVYEGLQPYLDQYVYLPEASIELIPEMRFGPQEGRLVETIRAGSWRLRELYAVSPMSRSLTAAAMLAFKQLEFVAYKTQQDDTRLLAGLSTVLARKKSQILKGTHFEVLEVHWICVGEEVEVAYKRLKEEYTVERFRKLGPEAVKDCELINARLDEGRRVLTDEHRRREYRKEVIEETKIATSAELLDRQGEMALMRNDRKAAQTCYGKAAELVPGNASYRASFARAKGLSG